MKRFLVILFLLYPVSGYASCDKTGCDINLLIDFIVKNTDLQYNNEQVPTVIVQSQQQICRGVFEPPRDECDIAGYYNDDTNEIFISATTSSYMVDESFKEVVLLHELVHFMQKINGVYETIECQSALESLAFEVQDLFVTEYNIDPEQKPDPLFALLVSQCKQNMHGFFGEQ
tara:strand:- start:881 stop:1399 length:519 start_codon:yes stop_codon:yes gene_type:complete